MNKLLVVVIAASLGVGGCNKPAPVELQQDADDSFLDVSSVSPSDSSLNPGTVDSSAVLPEDQLKFAGLVQIAHVTFDAGQLVVDTAFTHVLFENRAAPVRVGPRIIGYRGIDLGRVTINGTIMFPVLHRLGRRDSVSGFEYYRNMTSQYRPETEYRWAATPDTTIGAFTTSIITPGDLVVQSPRGGSVIHRDRNLALSWTGSGNLAVVISSYDPVAKKSKPIFRIAVRNNKQHAMLSSKVLRLLPPGHLYLFTFVLSNRKETETVARFPGRVLVQASAVYNSYVEII